MSGSDEPVAPGIELAESLPALGVHVGAAAVLLAAAMLHQEARRRRTG